VSQFPIGWTDKHDMSWQSVLNDHDPAHMFTGSLSLQAYLVTDDMKDVLPFQCPLISFASCEMFEFASRTSRTYSLTMAPRPPTAKIPRRLMTGI
jgi:hypothetical protein